MGLILPSIMTKPLRILLTAIPLLLPGLIHAEELELIAKTTVDEEALTFAAGPAARFGLTVNGRSHQQSPLITSRGFQYVTWFDAKRQVCIGRRKLPRGNWEVIRFSDHHFKTNDSHNTAVIGICEKDGTIHMAFDHHATQLNYRISEVGAAHNPETVKWEEGLFGGVLHTLGDVEPEKRVTYPRFFNAPNGNLMLYYRGVTSADGNGVIEEYDGEAHQWTPGLGKFIARDIGVYSARGETSNYRCPYMDSLSFAGERLHASWIWRDRFERTLPENQHDLCYAYSDDYGRTWHNSAGEVIGETGKSFIHLDTPGLVVAPIPVDTGLSNQNTHYAYPDGSIHVMLIHQGEGSRRKTYQHHWRTSTGEWKTESLPFSGKRPKLLGTPDRELFVIYSDSSEVKILRGLPKEDGSGWSWSDLPVPGGLKSFGEPLVDLDLWKLSEVISIYSQEVPEREIRTSDTAALDGVPSALHVSYYRMAK